MSSLTMLRRSRGFSLLEILVATLCLGLCLAPILIYLGRLPELQRRLGLKARDDAWRSFQEHAMASGLEAGAAEAFSRRLNPIALDLAAMPAERLDLPLEPGRTALRILRPSREAAAGRVGSSGWELAKGLAVPAALPPALPLYPLTHALPELSPGGSAAVSIGQLSQGEPAGASLWVSASVSDGSKVFISAGGTVLGSGNTVGLRLSALALASGAHVRAWSEYPGDPAAGDIAELLSDGRRRWTVSEASGLRRHEPSAFSEADYVLNLGSPVLLFAGAEMASGQSLSLSRTQLAQVETGGLELRVTWPKATLDALGSSMAGLLQGFETSMSGLSGGDDGMLASLCAADQLGSWTESNELRATPRVPSSCVAGAGSWLLLRSVE